MSFGEKSAWALALVSALVGGAYVFWLADRGGPGVPGPIVLATVGFIVLTIFAHIVIVMTNPRAADVKDERDLQIERRAEVIGSRILAAASFGVVLLAAASGQWLIANLAFSGLVVSEFVKAFSQIVFYRQAS